MRRRMKGACAGEYLGSEAELAKEGSDRTDCAGAWARESMKEVLELGNAISGAGKRAASGVELNAEEGDDLKRAFKFVGVDYETEAVEDRSS